MKEITSLHYVFRLSQAIKLFGSIVFRKWEGVTITPRIAWEITSSIWMR